MILMSIPTYLNPTQVVEIELNWEIGVFVVSGISVIPFSSSVGTVAPLGVLKVLLWYILFSSWRWKCVGFEGHPLKLGSANEVHC